MYALQRSRPLGGILTQRFRPCGSTWLATSCEQRGSTVADHISAHEHKQKALKLIEEARGDQYPATQQFHLAEAQLHATLAIEESLYELFGNDSLYDRVVRGS